MYKINLPLNKERDGDVKMVTTLSFEIPILNLYQYYMRRHKRTFIITYDNISHTINFSKTPSLYQNIRQILSMEKKLIIPQAYISAVNVNPVQSNWFKEVVTIEWEDFPLYAPALIKVHEPEKDLEVLIKSSIQT